MDWKQLISTVGKAAPLVGSLLGPAGTGVGTAVSLVANLFGADPEDPQDMFAKMTADPEYTIKLQQLQMEHKVELEKLNFERDKLRMQEKAQYHNFVLDYEGRAREIPKTLVWLRSSIRPVLTYTISIAYILGWFGLCNPRIPAKHMELLSPALLMVLGFWFTERLLQRSGLVQAVLGKKEKNVQ